MAGARWQPAKPRKRIKVVECGRGHWDDSTTSGTFRIRSIASNVGRFVGFNEKQPEHRIADWLCRHACSFILFDTKAGATVIGFEREDDAEAFRREFMRG